MIGPDFDLYFEEDYVNLHRLGESSRFYFLYMKGFIGPMVINNETAARFIYKIGRA